MKELGEKNPDRKKNQQKSYIKQTDINILKTKQRAAILFFFKYHQLNIRLLE